MLIGDSAFPPATYPTQFQGEPVVGWVVYIPGGDAYHGWSQAEIEELKAQPWCQFVLPCFVRSNPQGAPQAAQDAAAVAAWSRAQGQPAGTLVMTDYETAVDSPYEVTFDQDLHADDGDEEILYGSKATVVQNTAPSGGYDEADWTGVDSAPGSMATQFYSGADYDLNDFRADAPLWRIRGTAPASSTAVSANPTSEEDDNVSQQSDSNGLALLQWAGSATNPKHVLQFFYDGAQGPAPSLRVDLGLSTGPFVLTEDQWVNGRITYDIPADFQVIAWALSAKASNTPPFCVGAY